MDTVLRFVTVLLIFLFVLFITHITTKIVGNYQKNSMSGGTIRLLEGVRLNNNTYIQIVRVAGKILVLAVSKESVSTVCELTEEEYNRALEEIKENPQGSDSFAKFFEHAKEVLPRKKN